MDRKGNLTFNFNNTEIKIEKYEWYLVTTHINHLFTWPFTSIFLSTRTKQIPIYISHSIYLNIYIYLLTISINLSIYLTVYIYPSIYLTVDIYI